MTKLTDDELYIDMIYDCQKYSDKLTDWEREFIDSIEERLDNDKDLTIKQIEILTKIHKKAF